MANFSNLSLTVSGVKALLEAQTGKTLTLTKIGLGSGSSTNVTSLKNLVTPKLMLPISETQIDSNQGLMTIIANMTNESISEGFYWKETGLFFKDASGNDVLFAYACITDNKYDYIPAYSDQRYVKNIRIANIITNTANITVEESVGLLYVDTVTFNAYKESTNAAIEDATIKASQSGEIILAEDSAEAPFLGMKLFGKTVQGEDPTPDNPKELVSIGNHGNLFDKSNTTDGYATDTDGELYSDTTMFTSAFIYVTPGETYSIVNSTSRWTAFYDNEGQYVGHTGSTTFTVPDNAYRLKISCLLTEKDTVMLFLTSEGITAYRPYSGNIEVGVSVFGKNILKVTGSSGDSNGITFTVNSDGTIKVSGTATNVVLFKVGSLSLKANTTYICDKEHTGVGQSLRKDDGSTVIHDFTSADTYTPTEDIDVDFFLRIGNGVTVSTLVYPMVRLVSADDDTYEPYKEPQTIILKTDNGLPGIPVTDEYLANYTDENGQMWCCDEVDLDMGVYVNRIGIIDSYNGETVITPYMSTTGALDTGAKVLYVLSAPTETDLTAAEIAAYKALHTNKPVTTIMNDCDAYTEVEYFKATANGESAGRIAKKINDSDKKITAMNNVRFYTVDATYDIVASGTAIVTVTLDLTSSPNIKAVTAFVQNTGATNVVQSGVDFLSTGGDSPIKLKVYLKNVSSNAFSSLYMLVKIICIEE